MSAFQDFSPEVKFAAVAYLVAGILLSRRLDRRIAGSRVQMGDYVLCPLFLPLIALLAHLFDVSRKAFRAAQTFLAFHPRDD